MKHNFDFALCLHFHLCISTYVGYPNVGIDKYERFSDISHLDKIF